MRNLLISAGVATTLIAMGFLFSNLQEDLRATRPILPITFAHADHLKQTCVGCHHNFTDTTGQGLCFECHKTDPTVSSLIETQFHDLCRDCHVEKQLLGEGAGPVRACIDCHLADDDP